MASFNSWSDHIKRSQAYARMIDRLFQDAVKECIRISMVYNVKPDPKIPFSFSDLPILNTATKKIFKQLHDGIERVIETGSRREWLASEATNDQLVNKIIGTLDLPKKVISKYKSRNLDALETFQTRKINGMNLSERVWNLTTQFQGELEMALDIGLGEGRSAVLLSQDVRQYLNEPNKLFRRVRDKHGKLQLSKAAKNYHPGQGVYRSSYKNAMRLTRTEVSMAYREADHERWKTLDFVVGFEQKRSNNLTECDVCDSFTGLYPKQYRFNSVHPHCRCFAIPILATQEERDQHFDRLMDGKQSELTSKNTVKKMPESYMTWIKDNKKKLLTARSTPYFIRDNFKGGTVAGGLNFM